MSHLTSLFPFLCPFPFSAPLSLTLFFFSLPFSAPIYTPVSLPPLYTYPFQSPNYFSISQIPAIPFQSLLLSSFLLKFHIFTNKTQMSSTQFFSATPSNSLKRSYKSVFTRNRHKPPLLLFNAILFGSLCSILNSSSRLTYLCSSLANSFTIF